MGLTFATAAVIPRPFSHRGFAMLQWIHDRLSKVFWFIMAPLTIVFTLWGVHGVVDFGSGSGQGIKVNGEELPIARLKQDYQGQMAQLAKSYPDEIPADIKQATRATLVDQYVNTTLLNQKVNAAGYKVTDSDVIDSIQTNPAFQVDGKFSKDAYYGLLQTRGLTPDRFETDQRAQLKSRALEVALVLSAFATVDEVRTAVALQDETREVASIVLPVAHFAALAKPDRAAVQAYYAAHLDQFKSPDTVRLSYVELKFVDSSGPVDDASLQAYFETVKDRYTQAEKRRARHILIQAGTDAAAAQKKAQEIYALATKPGADFSALAKQYSQDSGSAAQGGDLGMVEKSFFVGPFANAVFAMKVGEIKGPVKTPFGWHVIQLQAIEPALVASFDSVKAALTHEYQKTEGERQFGERQEKIEQLAFEASGTLAPIAKALNLSIEEVPAFYDGLTGNALASNPKVLKAAFSADVLAGQNSRPIEIAPGDVIVLRASDRRVPAQLPIDSLLAKAEDGARRELGARDAKAAAARLVANLSAGTAWDAVVKSVGGIAADQSKNATDIKVAAFKSVGRKDRTVAPDVLSAAFAATAPSASQVSAGSLSLSSGDWAVFAVSKVAPGVLTDKASASAEKFSRSVGAQELGSYLMSLKAKANIKMNPSLFE